MNSDGIVRAGAAGMQNTAWAGFAVDERLSVDLRLLRFISIVLVVYIHAGISDVNFAEGQVVLDAPSSLVYLQEIVSGIIGRVAVPLFFTISGLLLFARPFTWWGNISRKSRTILVPYLLWNSIWIAAFAIGANWNITSNYFSNPGSNPATFGFAEWIGAYAGVWTRPEPFLFPFWFLRDLYLLNVFAPVIGLAVRRYPLFVGIAMTGLWFSNAMLPFGFGRHGLVFFTAGAFVALHRVDLDSIYRLSMTRWSVVFVAAVALDFYYGREIYQFHHVLILIGVPYLARVVREVQIDSRTGKFLLWCAGYTFTIYAAHEYTLLILTKLAKTSIDQTPLIQTLEYVALPMAVIALCVLLGVVTRRSSPSAYALLTGGR